MKLDFDCVRDILITLERQDDFVQMIPQDLAALLPKYSHKQIVYTCRCLHEGGYLHLFSYDLPYGGSDSNMEIRLIGDLTFKGHEFLAGIKPQNKWDRISYVLKQAGTASLDVIATVATSLGVEALKESLGL